MSDGNYAPELELRPQLRALWRRKRLLLAVAFLVAASALVLSFLQGPRYEGALRVLLESEQIDSLFQREQGQREDPARRLATEIEVAKSEPVRAAVLDRLGAVPEASVDQVAQANMLEIRAQANSPARAAEITEAYATEYIDFRRKQVVNELDDASGKLQEKINDLQTQITALEAEMAVAGEGSPTRGLEAARDQLLVQQALFRQRVNEMQVDAELTTGGARLVTQGPVPTEKVQPKPLRNGLVGLVIGLILGTGVALLVQYLDDTVRTKDDMARAVPGVPMLGLVPKVHSLKLQSRPGTRGIISLGEPSSAAAEAYRSIRTSLQFLGVQRRPQVFQVTSPNAGEGKTTTVANLGVAMARAGLRVAIVDCDLRRAALTDAFDDATDGIGFTSVFLQQVPLTSACWPVPGLDNLLVLPSGPLPPNPSEVLTHKRTAEILSKLQDNCDIVILDSPPVLPVTDAIALSSWVDATLLIASAGITTSKELQAAVQLLEQAQAPLVGTVLNQVTEERQYGYPYPPTGDVVGGDGKQRGTRRQWHERLRAAPGTPPAKGDAAVARRPSRGTPPRASFR